MIWIYLAAYVCAGIGTGLLLVDAADKDFSLSKSDLGDLGFIGFTMLGCLFFWPAFLLMLSLGWLVLRALELVRRRRSNSLPLEER